jgi:hypothetical protein
MKVAGEEAQEVVDPLTALVPAALLQLLDDGILGEQVPGWGRTGYLLPAA